jgi:DNA-directed RNA polymerase subunit M/transcription elongation factor TFIIS
MKNEVLNKDCDRCGEKIGSYWFCMQDTADGTKKYICEECGNSFREWWNKIKNANIDRPV